MAHSLMLPDGLAPSNLHLRPSVKTRYVEGDVFDICGRLAEVSPRLYLVELTEPDRGAAWVVMESCDDGEQRMVKKYQELDARMIVDVQRMLSIPLEHRIAAAQGEIDRADAARDADALEALYENMGRAMHRELDTCGFIDSRPTSYPKRGVAQPGRHG